MKPKKNKKLKPLVVKQPTKIFKADLDDKLRKPQFAPKEEPIKQIKKSVEIPEPVRPRRKGLSKETRKALDKATRPSKAQKKHDTEYHKVEDIPYVSIVNYILAKLDEYELRCERAHAPEAKQTIIAINKVRNAIYNQSAKEEGFEKRLDSRREEIVNHLTAVDASLYDAEASMRLLEIYEIVVNKTASEGIKARFEEMTAFYNDNSEFEYEFENPFL